MSTKAKDFWGPVTDALREMGVSLKPSQALISAMEEIESARAEWHAALRGVGDLQRALADLEVKRAAIPAAALALTHAAAEILAAAAIGLPVGRAEPSTASPGDIAALAAIEQEIRITRLAIEKAPAMVQAFANRFASAKDSYHGAYRQFTGAASPDAEQLRITTAKMSIDELVAV